MDIDLTVVIGLDAKTPGQWKLSLPAKVPPGFAHARAHHGGTEWWMKIDTDVVAMKFDKPWKNADWFQHDVVLIASPWGYSKCKGDNRTALEWAEPLEEFGYACWTCTPRLGLTECVRGR